MKTILLFLISFIFSAFVTAQIQRIESGQYKFAKGEIELFLVDTVSKEYAELEIGKTGYEIISSNISPITFYISGKKGELLIDEIESKPLVNSIRLHPSIYDSMAVEKMIIRQNMNKEEADRSRKSFRDLMERTSATIFMHYHVNERMADEFFEENKEYKLQRTMISPRSVTVKTIPGKENEAMRELKRLDIVESAAFIALINE